MLSNLEIHGPHYPLTGDESAMLQQIYKVRIRVFITTYAFLLLLAFKAGMSVDGGSRAGTSYKYDVRDNEGFSRRQMYGITIPFMEAFVAGTGIVLYRKRILPLKKDRDNKVKEAIYYTVTQKQVFEHTGQYFIGLNHPDYLFHEVDFDTWNNTKVGDPFAVYRAPLSKYVFNARGKFTIM